MQRTYGELTTFGDDELKTLLMVVLRNATTDSPWPLSNNPDAKYNDPARPDCNLNFPLWQLVRASTAAPTYFPPELIKVGEHPFVFVDGGVTMYNNPAFQLFLMATLGAYRLGLAHGRGQDAVGLRRYGYGGEGRRLAAAGRHEPSLQCEIHSGGADVGGAQRAGPAVQGIRTLPSRCPDRPGSR